VALALAAQTQLQLDCLHIIPTGFAWHKSRSLTQAEHRLAMCELAFSNIAKAVIDPREIRRSGPTYTADTLQELQREYPQAQLFLVVGEDQWQSLSTWHRIDEVVKNAIICVAARPDSSVPSAAPTGAGMGAVTEIPVMQLLQMPAMPLSATSIRQIAAQHENLSPLVFDSVARYIDQHHLYQSA
jgi:nicotinate-nucleotide adenylyltransferase